MGVQSAFQAKSLGLGIRPDVSIKPERTAFFPILRVVGINPGPLAQEAKEHTPSGIDYDPDMSVPDHQVTRLRLAHTPK